MKKPELPKQFKDNLEQIAEGLHGRPINADFSSEWKISAANVMLLLEYLYTTGMIEIIWDAAKQVFCFVKRSCVVN